VRICYPFQPAVLARISHEPSSKKPPILA
jgi:hypothetical protein